MCLCLNPDCRAIAVMSSRLFVLPWWMLHLFRVLSPNCHRHTVPLTQPQHIRKCHWVLVQQESLLFRKQTGTCGCSGSRKKQSVGQGIESYPKDRNCPETWDQFLMLLLMLLLFFSEPHSPNRANLRTSITGSSYHSSFFFHPTRVCPHVDFYNVLPSMTQLQDMTVENFPL